MNRLAYRLAITAVALLFASIGLVAALVFATVGVYFLFAEITTPTLAAFGTAASAVLFSIAVIGLGFLFAGNAPKRGPARRGQGPSLSAAALGDFLGRQLRAFTGSQPRSSLFASFAAGFAVGASPRLREFLLELVRS
jgi:hypothetical protein